MKSRFKEHLLNLRRLRVAAYRDIHSGLFLDRNERIMPFEPEILKNLHARIAKTAINLYPDLNPFYDKLSKWLGVDKGQIYVTEGVSGGIKSLVETIAVPGDNVVFPTPTFALYPVYCDMFKVKYKTVGYTKDYALDVEKLIGSIDNKTALVFLPNPNNPIEGTLEENEVALIAERCRKHKAFLAVDEVYYPFGGPTCIDLIKKFENIFLMRSFSKAFGLAGIRFGYLIGRSENVEYVSKTRTGYETNVMSMEVASFFIDNYRLVEDYVKQVREGLRYLTDELEKMGLEHNGGMTSNFVYVNLRDSNKAKRTVEDLKARGIHIRANWPKPYDGGFSVTGAPKEIMEKFVKELSEVMHEC